MNDGPEQDWHDGSDGTGPPGGNAGGKQGGRGGSFLLLGKKQKNNFHSCVFNNQKIYLQKSLLKRIFVIFSTSSVT